MQTVLFILVLLAVLTVLFTFGIAYRVDSHYTTYRVYSHDTAYLADSLDTAYTIRTVCSRGCVGLRALRAWVFRYSRDFLRSNP